MRLFANMIRELQSFSQVNTPDLLFDELMEKTGYIRALEEKNTAEDNRTHTDKTLPEEVQPMRTAVIQPEKTQPVLETENSTEKKQTNAVAETGSENENISGGKTRKPSKAQEKHSQDANGTHPERKNRRFKSRKYRGTKKWKNENGTKDEGGNGK